MALLDAAGNPTGASYGLVSQPADIVAARGKIAVGFPGGDLAVIDAASGRHLARSAVVRYELPQPVVEIVLDQLLAVSDTLYVTGRYVIAGTQEYRGFVETRSLVDLALQTSTDLGAVVVQDMTADSSSAPLLLLDNGDVAALADRQHPTHPLAGQNAQILRTGAAGGTWVVSPRNPATLRTPHANVALPADSYATDLVLTPSGQGVLLLGDAGDVWIIAASGTVEQKLRLGALPYAAAVVSDKVFIGLGNADTLVVLDTATGQSTQHRLGHGVVRVMALE